MNNQNVLEFKWGTPKPYVYNDPKYGEVELLFRGVCSYTLNNVNDNFKIIEEMLFQNIVAFIPNVVANISGEEFSKLMVHMSANLSDVFMSYYPNLGVVVSELKVRSIDLTEQSQQKVSAFNKQQLEERRKIKSEPVVIQTDVDAKDGQNKCPKCGATEISLNVNTGKLKCRYCRYEFEPEHVNGLDGDISQLQGQVMGSGATDIVADTNDMITFKCSSCGAEVVVDTSTSVQARCHWCRNTLSVNQQIPNGSIPDVVLPFAIKKEDARVEIEKFVAKRKFFAHPKFTKEFTTENIMGVYFPYMLVDVNAHANLIGQGEKLVRTYTRGSGDNRRTYYDADVYEVTRDFDLTIDDLTVESSADKLNKGASDKTTNIINAIMPFDTENCVKWNANYIKGYTSEKRDTNVEQLKPLVDMQAKDIARFAANDTLKEYDRGVAWSSEQMTVKGQQWKAAYLPVWLYSYQEVKGNKKLLHYVAVNARTKETMGSVPIHMPKLISISCLVELIGILSMLWIDFEYNWIFLFLGFVYFFIIFGKYRNKDARHKHEIETKKNMINVSSSDNFIVRRTGLSSARIDGANNTNVSGQGIGSQLGNQLLNQLADQNSVVNLIKNNVDKNNN